MDYENPKKLRIVIAGPRPKPLVPVNAYKAVLSFQSSKANSGDAVCVEFFNRASINSPK